MKATAQKVGAQGKTATTRASSPEAKVRSGAGNRHRADALERQAEQFASRVVSGNRVSAGRITPTGAAHYSIPGNSGSPLPTAIREMMEGSLNADLRNVRVHVGSASDLATRERAADAFASGRDIFFRDGRYEPYNRTGQHLIAHELVHVLQQTGRVTQDGRLLATVLSGSGEVQCQPTGSPPPPSRSLAEQEALFQTLAERFTSRSTATDLQQTIDDVRTLLAGRLDTNRPEFAADFRRAVRARTFNSRAGDARGFILDCLKVLQFFDDAAWLIERDTNYEMRVAVTNGDFITDLESRGVNWAGDALRLREFSEFWPSVIVRGYRDFLLRPHSPPPPENAQLATRVEEEIRRRREIADSTELVPQDRVLVAWIALREMDRARVAESGEVHTRSGTTTSVTATEQRQRVLQALRTHEQEILDDDEQPAFRRLLAERLLAVVREVSPIWEGAAAAYVAWQARYAAYGDAFLLQAPAERFPHSSLTASFLQTLRPILVTQTQSVLALVPVEDSEPAFPTEVVYEERLRIWRDALSDRIPAAGRRAAQPPILQQLDEAILTAVRARRPVQATIQGLTLLSFILDRLIQLTLTYDRQADEDTPTFPDERAGHRIRFARAIAWLARWMQWSDLLDATRSTLTADATGRVQLWLMSEWEPEPVQPIDRLEDDFQANINDPIIRDTPLTVRHLVQWFHLDYNTRLRATLREIVRQEERAREETDISADRINALRQSREEVRAAMLENAEAESRARELGVAPRLFDLRVPQRFIVRDWEVALPPQVSFEWDRIIEEHQKTQLSLVRHRPDGNYSPLIFPTSTRQGVFAWALPSLRPLIQILRGMPSLRRIAGGEGLSDEDWLERLDRENLSEAQWAEINRRISTDLERRNEQVARDLPDLWLRFNILRRRVLIMRLRPGLTAFIENRSVAFGPVGESDRNRRRRLMAPSDTITAIQNYSATVEPAEMSPVQTTLLLLGLADLLEQIVTDNDAQPDFGRGIYPYLLTALDFLSGDADKVRQLQRGTNVYDEVGNIVHIPRNLQQARRQLQNLKTAIDNSYRAAQATIGFRSENGTTIVPIGFHTEIYPSHTPGDVHEWSVGSGVDEYGRVDPATGTRYRLIEVYRRFTYHPAIGSPDRTGPGVGARYIDENGVEYPRINEGGQTEPIPHVPLFRLEIDGEPREVHADQGPFLYRLNEVFLWRSFQIQMENLAFLSEEYIRWIQAVVGTIVPGVTYAEIATTAMQLILSGEIEEIVRQLRDDPADVLQRLIDRLRTELFTPENVWRFVLLGGQHNPFEALRDVLPTRARRRTTVPPSGRLGRIIARLRQLGQRIRDALHRIRLYADGPIRSVQGNIAMRPTLAWLLRRAAHLIEAAFDLIPPEVIDAVAAGRVPTSTEELSDAVTGGIQNTGRDMEANVVRLLETIHRFELPYELLDLGAATEIILGFITDRFGPRARLVRMVLTLIPIPTEHEGRFTGMRNLYQAICGEIARVWRDTPVDPNVYWRSNVIPGIGDKFRETRDELVDGLYTATDVFLDTIHQPRLPRPTALPETNVEAVQEVEGSFSPQVDRFSTGPWQLQTGGGRALSSSMRGPFERSFGQQFSHVRLHQGSEARTATEPIGANAVTSGSHIFVHPSQSLSGRGGQRLLAHELTHVIQQTGSHPFNQSSPAVRSGRPHRGLLLDSYREKQADLAAGQASEGKDVSSVTTGEVAPQPALSERLVNSVIDTITVAKSSNDFTQTPRGGTAAHVPGIELARQLWSRVVELINTAEFAGFLHAPAGISVPGVSNPNVQDLIKQQLRDRHQETIGSQIPGIAQLAQRPRAQRQQNEPETELNPARFVNLLEDFIAAERGIAIQMSFNPVDNTISRLNIFNVLLQNVGGTSHLWKIVMHASFAGHSTDVPDLSAAQGEIRQRLRALPPSPGIFALTSFQFSTLFVNDYLELVRSRGRSVDDIPNVSDYTTATNNRADSLAVSTHGNLTSRGIGPFSRESHHTTQYLLVEFFGNLEDASRKAFPPHHTRYPSGIEFKRGNSGEVKGIRSGGRYLDVEALNPDRGRGNNMPAVLLSARTHQRGELHVLREARWSQGPSGETERLGTATQGFAIENTFNRALATEFRPHGDSEEHRRQFADAIVRDDAGANRALYNAAVSTYHWMYNRMIPALQAALNTEELAYYRGVAIKRYQTAPDSGELQTAYNMQTHHLSPVFRAAKTNNDHVMSGAGWPTPS